MAIELKTLKPSEVAHSIRAMMNTDIGMFLWGPPGISKSQVSQSVANQKGIAFIDFRLSQCDPSDLRGIPYPTKVGGVSGVRWSVPYVMPKDLDFSFIAKLEAEDTVIHFGNPKGSNGIHYCTDPKVEVKPIGRGLVATVLEVGMDRVVVALFDEAEYSAYEEAFAKNPETAELPSPVPGKVRINVTGEVKAILALEEFNSAPPAVQAAAYQLVLDRRLGEYEVPKGVFIQAMGNRDTDKGITYKMGTAISNRFVHIEMKPDFNDWQIWALTNFVHPDVIGYLSAFKAKLFEFDPGSASRGFPTPRSWEFVSKILKANDDLPDEVMYGLIAGAVGDGVAVEFDGFRKIATKLPKADEILSGRLRVMEEVETQLAYALTTTLCYELKERHEQVKAKYGKGWNSLKNPERVQWLKEADNALGFMMANFKPEICIMGSRAAIAIHKLPFETQIMKNFEVFAHQFKGLIM